MRSSRHCPRVLCALAVSSALLASGAAAARPEPTEAEIAQARERFGDARRLEDAGRWRDALEQLQRVAEVKMTPQVRFHLALCAENVGLWTQALDGYAQAASEAGSASPDVVLEANEHLRKLEATIPTVSLRVEGAAAGDVLYLDHRALPVDDHPLAIRADPGPHSAEVRRAGAVAARVEFTLAPSATRRIELRVGEGAPAGDGGPQRALALAALGLGGASAILVGAFLGLRARALDEVERACPSRVGCSRSLEPTVNDGKTYSTLVNVFAALAGAGVAGGVVLFATAPPKAPASPGAAPSPSAAVSAALGLGGAGLTLQGTF